jgi:hypothetical protein
MKAHDNALCVDWGKAWVDYTLLLDQKVLINVPPNH